MDKLSFLYGRLKKFKSASAESLGLRKSSRRRLDSEREFKQSRHNKDKEPKSILLSNKTGCMSEQLKRVTFSDMTETDLRRPRTPSPSGVFVGAEERIPTLRNKPWKSKTWSSDSEEEVENVFSSRSSERGRQSSKRSQKLNSNNPPTRTVSAPEELSHASKV